ncbi:nucleoporin NUP42 [Betta splendens]|uniref:Nucleoporin NUP42 n=1 Tax=Betta splendens TaxID=158456 RepID=A0A6P7P0G6_BETSP|nr:nucleoporin NUP42 [Betta splendens]
MTVCNFFLQGRCRYGDKCWNEHPRGGNRGGGGGHSSNYSRGSGQQQQPRGGGGGGGFGNRVWVNPNQQKGGYIQPSSFSSHGGSEWSRGGGGEANWGRGEGGGGGSDWNRGGGGSDWNRGGGGRRDNVRSADFNFGAQNRFSALDSPSAFDRGGRRGDVAAAGEEDDDKSLEIIQADMESWESSGQWVFSCYSKSKASLSGFTDLSPEELRLEYCSAQASGDLQSYLSGVNQLLNQWRNRIQELKVMTPATRAALLAELNNPAPQTSSSSFGLNTATGFGSSASAFGSKGFGASAPVQANSFSFAAPTGGFGSPAATGFGSAITAPTQPPSGFGSSSAVTSALSASTFSFAAPSSDKPAASTGFGSASGFSFSSAANAGGGFGSGFGTEAPAVSGSNNVQTSGGFGASAGPAAAGGVVADSLFSSESALTPEELNQFKAKRFTLGQIPLKPPPNGLLVL